ncbi:hypothetical protein OHC33_005289 [Knufia fluminis]|uniref:Uncharacterized protein n=1 Tax=Knufia fluminis TaxID=191047 RepID=A0AAN8I8T4_9EURO|nr:hypothetical protein OHC33_005289 [Knufia fluminis]
MVPSEMLGKLSMLLFYIFFLATGTLADNATNLSADYVVTEPWCIYELNFVTWSYAVVIPYDGSKTDDGLDKAGKCGDKLRDELPLKGVAITDCGYARISSAIRNTVVTQYSLQLAGDPSDAYTEVDGNVQMMEVPNASSGGEILSFTQSKTIQFNSSVPDVLERPSLVILGRDILVMVFDLIRDSSPKSLQAIASVSSEFYHLATYSRQRHLTMRLNPDTIQNTHSRLRCIDEQNLLPAIHFLDVVEPGEVTFKNRQEYINGHTDNANADQYFDCMKSIISLIPRMMGLKYLSWQRTAHAGDGIPDTVLEVLRSCPQVRLHAKVSARARPGYATHGESVQESNLDKLQGNANLSKLEAQITFYDSNDCLEATQPLKHILLSSPNIRSLSLSISQPSSGCVVYRAPREYCGFGFVGDEAIPPLEDLAMYSYPWGRESTTTPEVSSGFVQVAYPGKSSEMDYWAEKFDWSHLKRLKTGSVDFALKIMPKLTSLKEVDFLRSQSNDISRFYQQCPAALEAIGADSLQSIGLQCLLRHGSALRKLRLHNVEDYKGKWAEDAIDASSLRSIRDGCPLLEDLFVDVARDGNWPWPVLDVLATFPRLRNLTVCFEVGVKCRDNPVKPYVTFAAADNLYTYLRSRSPKQPSILSRFHIYSGAPPPMGFGYPAPAAFWPQYDSTEFICTLSERDDESAQGIFKVECPRIPTEGNARVLFGSSTGETAKNGPWRLAHEGPTPMRK